MVIYFLAKRLIKDVECDWYKTDGSILRNVYFIAAFKENSYGSGIESYSVFSSSRALKMSFNIGAIMILSFLETSGGIWSKTGLELGLSDLIQMLMSSI